MSASVYRQDMTGDVIVTAFAASEGVFLSSKQQFNTRNLWA